MATQFCLQIFYIHPKLLQIAEVEAQLEWLYADYCAIYESRDTSDHEQKLVSLLPSCLSRFWCFSSNLQELVGNRTS